MGFFSTLATILAPAIGGMIGLASFTNWVTALAYAAGLGVVCVLAVRFYEKHNRAYEWDDRLNDIRMDGAREWLVNTWKRGDEKE